MSAKADDPQRRIELTLCLWKASTPRELENYIERLLELVPRHRGRFERRIAELDAGPGRPDAVLVLSFPDGSAVDAYLHDPLRYDIDELAARAVSRSLITDGRTRSSAAAGLLPVSLCRPVPPSQAVGSHRTPGNDRAGVDRRR